MKVELLEYTPNPERVIAAAAKLCYSPVGVDGILEKMTPESTDKFVDMLTAIGHESPVEHVCFTFAIEGVSRSLLAQITRHRIASFSVQSQRYVAKENFDYIIPPEIEKNPAAKALFIQAMENDRDIYKKISGILKEEQEKKLIAQGKDPKTAAADAQKLANEDARYVLPNACDTKIVMTMNVRSLYHFFNLRCCTRAQWEIRHLATEMLRLVKNVSPILFKNTGPSCVKGTCPEGKMSCGKPSEMRAFFKALS